MNENTSKALLSFIDSSPSCYHVISNISSMLSGFTQLLESDKWEIERGKSYYVKRNGSSIIAFRIPSNDDYLGYMITAAHSDSPSFKVKANAEMTSCDQYVKLNVEKYGGMLMAPWFDRPLSVAGRITVQNKNGFSSKLVNVDRDLLMIPNLAIHMNRKANEDISYNAQTDMLPLFGMEESKGKFMSVIAASAGVEEDDILDYDLFLYNRTKGTVWGGNDEFISSRSLDDLQCAYSLIRGFLNSEENDDHIQMCCFFDNEEVGSSTKQGADSTFLEDVMVRINESLGGSSEKLRRDIAASFMISADNAHAVHPNYTEKADPTNKPFINKGIVIKYNANQKYTTDSISGALFKMICKKSEVPVQIYCNRSDIAGGSTLGNISGRHISLSTVDIGLPQLAMHSPYETAGAKDTEYLIKAIKTFYESTITISENGYSIN